MDEPTPDAPVLEGAPVDTPDTGTDTTQQTNWEERYKNLQSDYTRATQQLAQYKDPQEAFHTLAQQLGYQIEEPAPEEFIEDFPDTPDQSIDTVARQQLEQIQQQMQAQQYAVMEQNVNTQFEKLGVTDQQDQGYLLWLATQDGTPPRPDGMPDIAAAYETLRKRDEAAMQRWAESKKAPRIAPGGQTGTQVPDLNDDQARVAWMAQQWAAAAND